MKRLVTAPLVLLGMSVVTFVMMNLAPGDAARVQGGLGSGTTEQSVRSLRELYGLERPLPVVYLDWLSRSVRFDFGRSFSDGEPVREKLMRALPTTAALALGAFAIGFLLAGFIGTWLGSGRSMGRRVLETLLLFLYSLPTAAVALVLLNLVGGYGNGRALVGGMLVLAIPLAARISRYHAANVRNTLSAEYVRAVRAKGASDGHVLSHHVLRAVLLPLITLAGLELPILLSGSVLVEEVAGLPGLGRLAFESVLRRDQPMVLGLLTLSGVITLAALVLTEVLHDRLDPRLRRSRA